MSKPKAIARKYAPLWASIKQQKSVAIQITPLTLTEEQAEKAANVIRRAVSKEKYEDIHFKQQYPGASLTFRVDMATRTLGFELNLNTPEAHASSAINFL